MNDKYYVVICRVDTEVYSENEHGFYDTQIKIVGVASTWESANKVITQYEVPDINEDYASYEIYIETVNAI